MIPAENLHRGMYITVLGWSKEYERHADDSCEYTPVFHTSRRAPHPLTGNALCVMELSLPFITVEVCADGMVLILDVRDLRLHRVTEKYAASCKTGYRRRIEGQRKDRDEQFEYVERRMRTQTGMIPRPSPFNLITKAIEEAMETVPPTGPNKQIVKCPNCGRPAIEAFMGNPANPEAMTHVHFCTNCQRTV